MRNVLLGAEDQGDILTYLVLADNTQEVIACSNIRSANDPAHPNLRAVQGFGDDSSEAMLNRTLFSASDLTGLDMEPPNLKLPRFSPDELLGLTFIRDMPDGRKFRATLLERSRMTTLR